MAGNTKFDEFIAEEVKAIKGVYVPVKARILRRALIRSTRCDKLHPNPDDEFCMPKVEPNYGIISDYMKTFREERGHSRQYCDERLVVEKIRPDGYLILNGHHRWAAALRLGFSRIPIEIVDLTDETDIREILKNSQHDKRDRKEILPQKLPNRYRISLHVDDEAVICAWGREYGFNTYLLNAQDDEWKEKILRTVETIRKKEHPDRSETEMGIPDEKAGEEEDPT